MPTTMSFRDHPVWTGGAVIPVTFLPDPGEAPELLAFVVWCHPATATL